MQATDKELGELHRKVARQLAAQLENADIALKLIHEHNGELPDDVQDFLEKCSFASPALLTIAAKFLKDNDITCQVETSKEMTDLERRLADKKQRKAVGNVLPLQHEDE